MQPSFPCRWGVEFGGSAWRWDWSTPGDCGYTPMHLVAIQPDSTTTLSMLGVISSTVPAEQALAARTAWQGCVGGVGLTPAELYALDPGATPTDTWWAEGQAGEAASCSAADSQVKQQMKVVMGQRSDVASQSSGSCSSLGVASAISSASVSAPADAPTQPGLPRVRRVAAWLEHVRELLVVSSQLGYQTWAMEQVRGSMQTLHDQL